MPVGTWVEPHPPLDSSGSTVATPRDGVGEASTIIGVLVGGIRVAVGVLVGVAVMILGVAVGGKGVAVAVGGMAVAVGVAGGSVAVGSGAPASDPYR